MIISLHGWSLKFVILLNKVKKMFEENVQEENVQEEKHTTNIVWALSSDGNFD